MHTDDEIYLKMRILFKKCSADLQHPCREAEELFPPGITRGHSAIAFQHLLPPTSGKFRLSLLQNKRQLEIAHKGFPCITAGCLLIKNSQQKRKMNVVYKQGCGMALWGGKEVLISNNRYLFVSDQRLDALESWWCLPNVL